MNVLTQTIKRIVDEFGIDTLRDGKKTVSLFIDLSPQHKQEQTMLRYLVQCGGHVALLDALGEAPGQQRVIRGKLINKMVDDCLVSQQAAAAICDSFWLAIGGEPFLATNKTRHTLEQPEEDPICTQNSKKSVTESTQSQANNLHGNSSIPNGQKTLPKGALIGIAAAVVLVVVFAFAAGFRRTADGTPDYNHVNTQIGAPNNSGIIPTTEYQGPVMLFEMPITCEKNVTSGAVNHLYFSEEETDVAGYRHQDCYKICANETDAYIGFCLSGKYKTLSGTLCAYNSGEFRAGWLDFYDGDSFLFSTDKVSVEVPSTDFCFNVNDIDELIVYFRATDAGTWMLAEDFIISREPVVGSLSNASVELFNLPVYSKDDFYLAFDTKADDSAGNVYINTYIVCASPNDRYVRYDLDGRYSNLSGSIHTCNSRGDAWLEFYDGERYLFSTGKVGPEQNSATFSFDISGVKYLTIYSRSEEFGEWIVTEDFVLTK